MPGVAVRARNEMPADVLEALKAAGVLADFESRPPYQQNDYLGWISRATRPETKAKRIAQMLEELNSGGIYMKMPHPASAKNPS